VGTMGKTDSSAIDAYFAKQPPEARPILQRVRTILRKALPGAEETISYQIPTYRLGRTSVMSLAGWKEHYSLYPATDRLMAALGPELAPHRVSKGTLRFSLSQPVPGRLIARIAKLLAREAAERAKAKRARQKKRT